MSASPGRNLPSLLLVLLLLLVGSIAGYSTRAFLDSDPDGGEPGGEAESIATSPGAGQPETTEEEISLLFTLTAEGGSFEPGAEEGTYRLSLRDVGRQVIWFLDRPARGTGHIRTRDFVKVWDDFGFSDVPPNAALTVLGGHPTDTIALELSSPSYLTRTNALRFDVELLPGATGNLEHFEDRLAEAPPERFRPASLFIDDATGRVINGCLIAPYTSCEDGDLGGRDLSGSNLTGAWLTGAVLARANLSGANLSYARLAETFLEGTNFSNANLRHANLSESDFVSSNYTGAMFCNTVMPDNSINNQNC